MAVLPRLRGLEPVRGGSVVAAAARRDSPPPTPDTQLGRQRSHQAVAERLRQGATMIQQLRRHPRFKLEVPVVFSWREANGSRRRARGYTRDLGPGGMYLITPRTPPVGTTIGLDAFLPPISDAAGRWQIVSKGRVVRVEPNAARGTPGGFAAVSQRFVLRSANGAN